MEDACRCCLSPGIHKDVNATFMWLNNREVYSEMLQECFNIALLESERISTTICEECIKLLRRSYNFKRQVLHNEIQLLKTMSGFKKKEEKPKELKFKTPLEVKEDSDDYDLSDAEYADQQPTKGELKAESSLDGGDDWFLSDAEEAEEVKPTISKPLDYQKVSVNVYDFRDLVSAAIQHSTVMPFRWHTNKYLCFYCYDSFSSSRDLRHHTTTEHNTLDLNDTLRKVRTSSKIKFDVSDITCKKCYRKLDNLTEFFDHLIQEHDMKLNNEISEHLRTYKLSDDGMSCQECGQKFLFFGPLLSHLNRIHGKNPMFPCEICGKGFLAKADVIKHVQVHHTTLKKKICTQCNKICASEIALVDHMRRMHREEKLKCPECPEVLRSLYLKKRHMVTVHNLKQFEFKCDMCPKAFMFLSKLTQHKAMTHLKERNVTCEICGFKVYDNYALKLHMVCHGDSRPFQCEICKLTFRRKKSLDFHIRTHTNDRRYVCQECGKAFIQINGLKLHKRTHHSVVS